MALNRSGTDVSQRPCDQAWIRGGAGDAVIPAEKVDPNDDGAENGEYTNGCQKFECSHGPTFGYCLPDRLFKACAKRWWHRTGDPWQSRLTLHAEALQHSRRYASASYPGKWKLQIGVVTDRMFPTVSASGPHRPHHGTEAPHCRRSGRSRVSCA